MLYPVILVLRFLHRQKTNKIKLKLKIVLRKTKSLALDCDACSQCKIAVCSRA